MKTIIEAREELETARQLYLNDLKNVVDQNAREFRCRNTGIGLQLSCGGLQTEIVAQTAVSSPELDADGNEITTLSLQIIVRASGTSNSLQSAMLHWQSLLSVLALENQLPQFSVKYVSRTAEKIKEENDNIIIRRWMTTIIDAIKPQVDQLRHQRGSRRLVDVPKDVRHVVESLKMIKPDLILQADTAEVTFCDCCSAQLVVRK